MELDTVKTQKGPGRRGWQNFAIRVLAAAAIVGVTCGVRAEVDSDISGLITNATTLFGTVKTLVIAVVAFFLLLNFAKKVKAK